MMQFSVPEADASDNSAPAAQLDLLLIRMGGEVYALPSGSVREVMRYREYTPVPGAPPMLPGILSQRGVILPVVNIYPLLGIVAPPPDRSTRLVVLAHNETDLALLVEGVFDLAVISADTLEPAPVALDPARARFLRGIAQIEGQTVALLDLDELIAGLRVGD